MADLHNRRAFLRAAAIAGSAWATVDLLQVEEALAWAAQQAGAGGGAGAATDAGAATSVLSAAQAAVIDAMTSRILPAVDGRPGARDAGVIYFIDRSLATFNAGQRKLYTDGIADLNRRAAATVVRATSATAATTFVTLSSAQQDEILKAIEQTSFFQAARFDTIVGAFALPMWGGNRNYAGWHLLGFEHQPLFKPPFGYYDDEANRKG